MSGLKSSNRQKIISIVGTTATGKSDLALKLATQVIGEKIFDVVNLISVDSKQVYQGLEITSGADIPDDFHRVSFSHKFDYWQKGQINLHGVAIIPVTKSWSAADFKKMVEGIINVDRGKKRLIILVGGTGFYHDFLFKKVSKAQTNQKFRQKLEQKSVVQLQEQLRRLDSNRFSNMNNSDKNNKRRLSRAIEIALYQSKVGAIDQLINDVDQEIYFLFQKIENGKLKIKDRVESRINNGAIEEVKELIKIKNASPSALSTIGVTEISDYLDKKISQEELVNIWTLHELQYSKRQLTWWKKKSNVKWLDVEESSDLLLYFRHV